MDDRLYLLQFLAKYGGEDMFGPCLPPRLDPALWDRLLQQLGESDHQTLAAIVNCLREDTSDFCCIDKIIALVEEQGFDTTPRHDFG